MNSQLPVVAIVGRPNVGKSSLFNRLIRMRKAIVGDRPGVTVDRIEHEWKLTENHRVILVDTGGIGVAHGNEMQSAIDAQVDAALDVADAVIFVVDAQVGSTAVDVNIAKRLRCQKMPVLLLVNKAEKHDSSFEFYELGLGDPVPVSAAHGQGTKEVPSLLQPLVDHAFPENDEEIDDKTLLARISVVGRPNVGKSSLINAWLKRERMVVSSVAGTTRDAIDSDLSFGDETIRLIDTAGQRKQGRISDVIEFVSRVKAQQALRRSDVAVLLLDGTETIVEQDMRLLNLIEEEGCALVVAVNKGDMLLGDDWAEYSERLHYHLRAFPDVKVIKISATKGRGLKGLLREAVRAAQRNRRTFSTGELNRWLQKAEQMQYAPSDKGAVVRLKYCAQVASNPPAIKIFCNRPDSIKSRYKRYLVQSFRKAFQLPNVPVRILFDATANPYAPKKSSKHG
ncbi:MAG: ribosome biogenesis GTPase Der [Mariprofundaceae bacterium]